MTEEGKRNVTKNLNRDAVLKSGGYSFLSGGFAPACHGCTTGEFCSDYDADTKKCLAIPRFQEGMEKEIMELPHIQEQDRLLVKRLCRYAAFLFITDEWLAKTSPFHIENNKLDFQPLVNNRIAQERLVLKISSQLGLTPEARARIGLNMAQTYSLAQAFHENEYDGQNNKGKD